ncbi:hypothetical protein GCM10027446_09110 [Angustibacter peucedani]
MSEPSGGDAPAEEADQVEEAEPRSRRRRRRATRPGTGSGASGTAADDGDVGWGERTPRDPAEDDHERWLHEQRPPHWD